MNIEHHLRHISIDACSVDPVAMSRAAVSCPVARLSAFYATIFLVTGIRLPFWPVWLVSRGLDGTIGSDADWRYRYPRCRALGCPRLRADSALGLGQLYPRLAR